MRESCDTSLWQINKNGFTTQEVLKHFLDKLTQEIIPIV